MEKQLDILEKMQEIDLSMNAAKEYIEDFPRQKEKLEAERREEQEKFDAENSSMEQAKKDRKRKERELEEGEEHLKLSQGRLYAAKSNKEYDAMLVEIENQKKKNSRLEEEILILYDRIDELEKEIKESKAKLDGFIKQHEAAVAELEAQLEKNRKKIDDLNDERERMKNLIEPDILATYERIRERLGDPAMARAVDEICNSCHRRIPPQLYNEVLKGDRVHTCPNCQRILVYRETEFLAAKEA